MAEGAAHRTRLAAEGNHLAGAAGDRTLVEEADRNPVVEADRNLAGVDTLAVEVDSHLAVGRSPLTHRIAQVEELRTDQVEVRHSLDQLTDHCLFRLCYHRSGQWNREEV